MTEASKNAPPNEAALYLAISVLNQALLADPDAINEMMRVEVQVNDRLGDHWAVQCGPSTLIDRDKPDAPTVVRPLGLINGLFGVDQDSWGYIGMMVGENGRIKYFGRLDRGTGKADIIRPDWMKGLNPDAAD